MSRRCQITGKTALVGHKVSHSNVKTKRRFEINLRSKRYWFEEENRWIHLRLSAKGMKIIDKRGLAEVVKDLRAKGVKV